MKNILILPILLITLFIAGAFALSEMDLASKPTQSSKEITIDIE